MPNIFDDNTFSETYKDDYRDSDGYYRILFNSGRALQARELTQSQTILQRQITRFGENIFLDGASVDPKSAGMIGSTVSYVKIARPIGIDLNDIIGQHFRRTANATSTPTTGLEFQITHIIGDPGDVNDSGYIIVYGRYVSDDKTAGTGSVSDTLLTPEVFQEGDVLTDTLELAGNPVRFPSLVVHPSSVFGPDGVTTEGGSNTGFGFLVTTQNTRIFTQGHFVFTPGQSIVASMFDPSPDVDIGFEVIQDIVTVDDTDALYDNQGVLPNLSSPGADRYRIRLILTTKESIPTDSDGTMTTDYVSFAVIRDGQIVQIKEGTENYNQVERRMAKRHHDTHGDFIVNPFDIRYEEGRNVIDSSATSLIDRVSEDYMVVHLPTPFNGMDPLAFVDGYRLEHEVPWSQEVPKPLSTTFGDEVEIKTDYNNYIRISDADSDLAFQNFMYKFTEGFDRQRQFGILNDSDLLIGKLRIKTIKRYSTGNDAYRAHIYDVQMDDGENFRNGHRIAYLEDSATVDGAVYFDPYLEDNQLFVQDALTHTNLFPISGGRVKGVEEVTYTVQKYFKGIVAVGNTFTLSTIRIDDKFDNSGSWFIVDHSAQKVLHPFVDFVVAGEGTQTATIEILDGSAAPGKEYEVFAHVEYTNPQVTSKEYKEVWMDAFRDHWEDDFYVEYNGDYLYDGVRLVEARDSDDVECTDLVTFDGGQTDNYYGPVRIGRSAIQPSATRLRVRVGYFEWAQGDYISVNSYTSHIRTESTDSDRPIFLYADIPSYTTKTTGETLELENYFDFRSKLDPTQIQMGDDRHDMPFDDGSIVADVTYYNSRIDTIAIGYSTQSLTPVFRVNYGQESLQPKPPQLKANEMPLFDVQLNGNTKNTEDLNIEIKEHKGWKMKDITRLEERVNTLEETVSLSFLEQSAANLIELDDTGNIRSKTGFFVDDFTRGMLFSSSIHRPEWVDDETFITETLDTNQSFILPKSKYENVTMIWDKDDDLMWPSSPFPGGNNNVRLSGDNIYLDYTEVLDPSMTQEMISWYSDFRSSAEHGYYNVNPYNVFTGEGFVRLSPGTDYWTETRRLANKTIDGGVRERLLRPNLRPRTFTATRSSTSVSVSPWTGRARSRTTTTTTVTETIRQSVRTRVIGDVTIIQDLGDRTVAVHSLPWMRQRRIFGKVQGLRPKTRYWPFFDGINVTQWVIKTDRSHHDNALQQRRHLRIEDPDISVGILQHPDAVPGVSQVLISDEIGELYFEFFLPNTARIPSANSRAFDSQEEWQTWIDNQRRLVKSYGSSKNPNVYNEVGWKFPAGSLQFKLLDISVDNEDDALSRARTVYTSTGDLNLRQRNFLSTRHITRENYYVNTVIDRDVDRDRSVTWFDPLAQTILIDPQLGMPGAYVTKIDIFLRNAPRADQPQIPIQLQIRGTENGYPVSGAISEAHRVYVPAATARANVDDIIAAGGVNNLGAVLANPTTFEFPEPIYLQAGVEYAIALLAECDNYEAYVATTYGLILGKTSARVNKQPAMGSLFLSQNGSTWTAKQNQDLAYRVYTAKFKESGAAIFANQDYQRYTHGTADTLSVTADDKVRVTHVGHGLGIGDRPEILGLDSAQSYFGVSGATIMDPTHVVDSADIAGYTIDVGATFTGTGSFGATDLTSNRAFYIDEAVFNFENVVVPETNINMSGSFISGVSHSDIQETDTNDPRFDVLDEPIPLANRERIHMRSPQMLAAPYMEEEVYGGDPIKSIEVKCELTTNQKSRFGGEDAIAAAANGYVSDVSPYIDTQRTSVDLTNFLIDNQARADQSLSDLMNVPIVYEPETHPVMGSSPSKHITIPVTLQETANGIKVFLEMYKPPEATFDLYYRTSNDPDADMYSIGWTYIAPENSPPNSNIALTDAEMEFRDWDYLIGGKNGDLPDFITFQLKIVFRSTNTSQIPVLKSLRAIALI